MCTTVAAREFWFKLANNSLPYLNGLCLILADSPTTKGDNLASWVLSFQSPTTSLVLVGTDTTGSIMIGANVCVHLSQCSGAASIHRERSIHESGTAVGSRCENAIGSAVASDA